MAIYYDAPVNPDDLISFVRQVPVPRANTFLNAFPRRDSADNTLDWSIITKTNRTARYRSLDGRIHVSDRDSGSKAKVSMIPLSTSLNQSEYETLQLAFARLQGGNQSVLSDAIYNDAQLLTEQVQNRLELAWGDVLTDGKLTINENGVSSEADFGVPAAQKVAAAIPWSNTATATPLTDLIAWSDVYYATNGVRPETLQISLQTERLLLRNTQLINMIAGAQTGRTFVSLLEINGLFASYGLPSITVLNIAQFDVDGTQTPAIATNIALLAPADPASYGSTVWGVSGTALELVNSSVSDLSFEEAPGIVGVVEKVGPPYRQFTFVDATAMPVLTNANLLMIATVS